MPPHTEKALPARQFGWFALGVAIFTIYGSLVPFNFRLQSLGSALDSFHAVISNTRLASRSDFAANFLLGVPLGFCLIAWRMLDTERSTFALVKSFLMLWPWCIGLAAGVEFAQLFFPGRSSSGTDILAQSAGSALGMALYAYGGQHLIDRFRLLFQNGQFQSPALGFCVVYVAVLVVNQLLPMDFSASPKSWVDKYREGKVVISPFAELAGGGAKVELWRKLSAWVELAALYFPIGLLLAFVPKTMPIPLEGVPPNIVLARACIRVFAVGLMIAGALEAAQILVLSRYSSVTDVILGGVAVFLGWASARALRSEIGLNLEAALILGQGWLLLLAIERWLPFAFDGTIGGSRFRELNWVPLAADLESNYLGRLNGMLSRIMVFLPLGAVAAGYGQLFSFAPARRCFAAEVFAAAAALVFEIGRLFLRERVPSPTDVMLAGIGGWIGATVAIRLRASAEQQRIDLLPQSPPVTPPPVMPLTNDAPIRVRL
jgi:glycopeptide antibiotics resistance protein